MKVLVIGDVIIDRYIHGRKLGVSAETPTIVAEYDGERVYVGGAGLVMRNLLRLGCEVTLLTIGDDSLPKLLGTGVDGPLPQELTRMTLDVIKQYGWKFTEKRRYYVDDYKMVQYDVRNTPGWYPELKDAVLKKFDSMLEFGRFEAVVIADNRHGVMMSDDFCRQIIKICKKHGVMTYVDSQVSQSKSNHSWYMGADWILVNDDEAKILLANVGRDSIQDLPKMFDSNFVVKRGAGGAQIFRKERDWVPGDSVQGFKVATVDTCGAGDAFLAAFVTYGNLEEANRWAALSTTYKGTIVPHMHDLENVKR